MELDSHTTLLLDTCTPFNEKLSGVYKRSFAYITIKDRLPVILTKVIDTLSRNKEHIIEQYGEHAISDIKHIIGFVSKLKNELTTNKTLKPLRLHDGDNLSNDDAEVWNKYLEEKIKLECEEPRWYNTTWLYCECYMYRVLAQEIALTNSLCNYDPFKQQKQESFINSINSIKVLSSYIMTLIHNSQSTSEDEKKLEFLKILQLSLWSNSCDLSFVSEFMSSTHNNLIEVLESVKNNIIINQSDIVWYISKKDGSDIIDIVLDNAGYELFTDICLAVVLCTYKLANKIRFHVKKYPWYVSDTTIHDFFWTLQYMNEFSLDKDVKQLATICHRFLGTNTWIIEEEAYWTQPYDFTQMREKNLALYTKLSNAALIIFKGDLNYRKLLSDINFKHDTKFVSALRDFTPTNILSLRTVKSDICVGLSPSKIETLFKEDKDWMTTGQYGLIQIYVSKKLMLL